MMKMMIKPITAVVIAAFTIVTAIPLQAASIVKATYRQDGNTIALMVYTGSDGGPNSDRASYWKLLGKAPGAAYKVKVKPDKPKGNSATLRGDIRVSVEIRNQFNMGIVKTDKLKLVRDDADSTRWYIPAKELKRIVALIDKKSAKDDTEAEQDGPDKPVTAPNSKPKGKDKPLPAKTGEGYPNVRVISKESGWEKKTYLEKGKKNHSWYFRDDKKLIQTSDLNGDGVIDYLRLQKPRNSFNHYVWMDTDYDGYFDKSMPSKMKLKIKVPKLSWTGDKKEKKN